MVTQKGAWLHLPCTDCLEYAPQVHKQQQSTALLLLYQVSLDITEHSSRGSYLYEHLPSPSREAKYPTLYFFLLDPPSCCVVFVRGAWAPEHSMVSVMVSVQYKKIPPCRGVAEKRHTTWTKILRRAEPVFRPHSHYEHNLDYYIPWYQVCSQVCTHQANHNITGIIYLVPRYVGFTRYSGIMIQ